MTDFEKQSRILHGLAACFPMTEEDASIGCEECPYGCCEADAVRVPRTMLEDIRFLLKEQEPRVLSAAEVSACPEGTVLWVEERQGVTWNLFPLEIETSSTHPDTETDYLFFITYHDIRRFECSEYNQMWRCWTSRPTNEQREATPWKT